MSDAGGAGNDWWWRITGGGGENHDRDEEREKRESLDHLLENISLLYRLLPHPGF